MKGKKITSTQRKLILKCGKGIGATSDNVDNWMYLTVEHVGNDEHLSKNSDKVEKWSFISRDNSEMLVIIRDIRTHTLISCNKVKV